MEHATTQQLQLSPFDQTLRLYVHKLFCFEFPDGDRQPEAVEKLEQALSATILRWPFIAGHISPAEDSVTNKLELRYVPPTVGTLPQSMLIVKNVPHDELTWTYQELVAAGMPPSAMKKEIFSVVPEWPDPRDTHPALSVQANFVSGGLILSFAFHHAVADGGAFTTFIKEFSAATRTPAKLGSSPKMDVQKRVDYMHPTTTEVHPLHSFPEYDYRGSPARLLTSTTVTTRILTISAAAVRKLQGKVAERLKQIDGPQAWVSDIACLSSLVWVAVVRARKVRLGADETAKIGIAVNARSVMNPPLPEDYFGNAVVHTFATAKMSELLTYNEPVQTEDPESAIPVNAIAIGASRMRQAVQGVNNTYVNERLRMFSMLADPADTSRAYTQAIDATHSGIDFSSWRDQGANCEFEIPGLSRPTVDFWRKAWSPNEGAYNILPRKGGSKGDANWEVSLGLSMEDMERACSKNELGGWISRVVE